MSEISKNSKLIFFSALIATVVSALLGFFYIAVGAWTFAPEHVNEVVVYGFPIEGIFINLLLLIAGLFLYEYLNMRFPENGLDRYSLSFSNLLLGLSIALGFFGYSKWYTIITFSILLLLLLYIEYINKTRFMYRFYRLYVLFLIPYGLLNWVLIEKGIVQFDAAKRIKLDVGIIPIDTYFYGMVVLLIAVFVLEKLKLKNVS